ncbi:TonB-dependent receptor domain-containing protein [Sphingomonas profundi]|uniref:TonB-dependent receptor domain-containing protein n=1 Tax=Alterirhizorhabdus profundi TaxID=2681549 RepID=UPI0012E7305C|nr:TonB-dependent receptor [Sphingomonas profundi]
MIDHKGLWRLCLLAGTALAPTAAYAQANPTAGPGAATAAPTTSARSGAPGASAQQGGSEPSADTPAAEAQTEEQVEISTPGADTNSADIVVRGRFIPNTIRATPQVVNVLSTADIARTGEGDIAGALTRVTGLSVVGNGFVYVRGLGDRYSSALLNGLPLPSPEPLKRVIPLDIFPTSVIASTLVQKSYSANYPGEFGGGVINLTTPSIPKEAFFNFGASVGVDTETTGKLGYTYYGSRSDYSGFDDGTRDVPKGLKAAIKSGNPIVTGSNFSAADLRFLAANLTNADTTLLQRNSDLPPNFSADMSAGKSWDIGSDSRFGVIASASFGNSWRTRDASQQVSNDPGLASLQRDFRTVITDMRAVVSGLLGFGLELGEHKIRWTNLYIRDTVKQGRLSVGYNTGANFDPVPNPDFYGTPPIIQQNTYWFERQLIDTQLVGEFRFGDLSVDARGGYANSQRESPYEREFTYTYDQTARDYVNTLAQRGGQSASVAFSDLNEDVYAGALDLGYKVPSDRDIKLSGGYAYNKTERNASRYIFNYIAGNGSGVPLAVAQERPDYLVSDYNVYTYDIRLSDANSGQGAAAYDASLEVHAGYGQIEGEITTGLRATAGVRYEKAKQAVTPIGTVSNTRLNNDYFLPAGTITWNFAEDMQLRVAGSKTIARPQFRELAEQVYQDFESDRQFSGNPFLVDSTLINAEGRYEYYFGRGERLSAAGFYKRIKNPIEQVAFITGGGGLRTGFANAPKADLYGGEVELVKYVPLDKMGGQFFATRRIALSANYTYTQSKLKVDDSMIVGPDLTAVAANLLYRNGAPLTGQSDHIANLQFSLEDTDTLSQQTLLINYASPRVTNRGPIQGNARQPDIKEKPGLRIDLVLRQEVPLFGGAIEVKAEGRNLTRQRYNEFQSANGTRVNINRYDLGRVFSLGATVKF